MDVAALKDLLLPPGEPAWIDLDGRLNHAGELADRPLRGPAPV